jgi:hypothetical protein
MCWRSLMSLHLPTTRARTCTRARVHILLLSEGAEPRGTFAALPQMVVTQNPADMANAVASPLVSPLASPPDNPSLLQSSSRVRRSKLPPLRSLPGSSKKRQTDGLLLSPMSEAMRMKLGEEPLPDDHVRQGAEPGEPAHHKSNGCGDAPNNGCADVTKNGSPDPPPPH